jgi:hypothetical protein
MASKKTKIPDKKIKANSAKNINKTNQTKKEVPVGVKVISILCFIFGGLYIIEGLIMTNPIDSFSTISSQGPELIIFLVGIFISLILHFLILAFISIILGIYLWKGNNLARIFTIMGGCLFSLTSLLMISMGILIPLIFILIFGVMACYLLFNKKVKEFFS